MKIITSINKGFTLAELVVSIFIISLLSAAFIANYHSAKRSGELNVAVQKFASDIRMAQNYTLGLNEFNGDVPDGGWGINIVKGDNKYTIFADIDGDGELDSIITNEIYKTVYLADGFIINNIILNDFFPVNTAINVIFIPPNPDTNIEYLKNNGAIFFSNLDKAEIEIKDSVGNTKRILVNKFGLVDVED